MRKMFNLGFFNRAYFNNLAAARKSTGVVYNNGYAYIR